MVNLKSVKIRIFLAFALLLCSFPSVKVFAEDTFVGICYVDTYIDNVLQDDFEANIFYDGSTYSCYFFTGLSGIYYPFSGISISPSVDFSYTWDEDVQSIDITFGSNFDTSFVYTISLYYEAHNPDATPTPTPTRGPSDTPTPTPWVDKTYGQSGGADTVHAYLRAFNGSYRFGSDDWFQPSSTPLKIQVQAPGVSGRFTGDILLPFPYKLDSSKFPVNASIAAEGYPNTGWVGTFSVGSEDGTVLHCDGIGWPNQWSGGRNMYIATITMTPSPTLSPTPTLTPYPSAAPASFSTYTINFVAPNGYIVGTVRPVLSIGSSYSGAISALTFSFLDGWFSYGDEVDGEKGSFTWEYSYSENFGQYLWHFSTDSWPASESINIPVYRLDGEYPEVVPDLNNVSDLFDTIGKTDPQNFSWFYDGLQAFIDINWNWAYLMLLFPLFVMLWAFFRRH